MTASFETAVELVEFTRFKRAHIRNPQGLALLKITNGLTVNYATEVIFGYHLDQNGQVKLDEFKSLSDISYDLSSEISACLHFLQEAGWINPKAKITITFNDKQDHNVRLTEWRLNAANINSKSAFLGDVALELTFNGQSFSRDWYCAKICELYYSEYPINPNVILTIGILLSQMWWKLDHEAAERPR